MTNSQFTAEIMRRVLYMYLIYMKFGISLGHWGMCGSTKRGYPKIHIEMRKVGIYDL